MVRPEARTSKLAVGPAVELSVGPAADLSVGLSVGPSVGPEEWTSELSVGPEERTW
jgi:hypothetical protein